MLQGSLDSNLWRCPSSLKVQGFKKSVGRKYGKVQVNFRFSPKEHLAHKCLVGSLQNICLLEK
jgi:hypothetical protein